MLFSLLKGVLPAPRSFFPDRLQKDSGEILHFHLWKVKENNTILKRFPGGPLLFLVCVWFTLVNTQKAYNILSLTMKLPWFFFFYCGVPCTNHDIWIMQSFSGLDCFKVHNFRHPCATLTKIVEYFVTIIALKK